MNREQSRTTSEILWPHYPARAWRKHRLIDGSKSIGIAIPIYPLPCNLLQNPKIDFVLSVFPFVCCFSKINTYIALLFYLKYTYTRFVYVVDSCPARPRLDAVGVAAAAHTHTAARPGMLKLWDADHISAPQSVLAKWKIQFEIINSPVTRRFDLVWSNSLGPCLASQARFLLCFLVRALAL